MLNDIADGIFSIHYKVIIEPWNIVCDALVWAKIHCRSNNFCSDAATYSLLYPTNGTLVFISTLFSISNKRTDSLKHHLFELEEERMAKECTNMRK